MDTTNEPVAWIAIGDNTSVFFDLDCALAINDNPTPLYTHPSEHDLGVAEAIGFDKGYKAATAKTLTDEEIELCRGLVINNDELNCYDDEIPSERFAIEFARVILKKANEKMILTCGCKSEHQGIFCEWDTETRECEPAVAYGCLCAKHYVEYKARPTEAQND